MEVRIVKKCSKKDRKEYVEFFCGDKIENKNRDIRYKANEVVFVEKKDENKGYEIKKYQTYKNLMDYLYENHNPKTPNRSLVINKFTNVFNLDKSYYSENEYSANDKEKDILSKIEKDNDCIKMSLHNRFDFLSFGGNIVDKLIIGLGNQSVYETGITLHHTYGVPYIPGQALKGTLRNYVIQNYFQKCDCEYSKDCQKICEKDANNHNGFSLIFGSKSNDNKSTAGRVIFMDSFPKNNFALVKDVMTPHHKDYYNGNSIPLDSDDPTPISFWAVDKEGLTFQFNIAIDKSISNLMWDEKNSKLTIKDFLIENLVNALNYHGIGAKTSIGYGYFNIDRNEAKNDIEKNNEKLQKNLEEEKLKKVMKDKSPFEIELYKNKKLLDDTSKDDNFKNDKIIQFYNKYKNSSNKEEAKKSAEFVKQYYISNGRWHKYNGKQKKIYNRILEICKKLSIEPPK